MHRGGGDRLTAPKVSFTSFRAYAVSEESILVKKIFSLCTRFYEIINPPHPSFRHLFPPTGRRKKSAFTLAEVLITLGIIGVVAAMTMPSLLNNAQDKELVSRMKKAYSVLSQATVMASMDNPIMDWNMQTANLDNTKEIYNYYKPYLNIVQDCGCDKRALGCWSKDAAKTLNGKTYTYGHEKGIGDTYCAVRLNDGMNVSFDTWGGENLGVDSASNVFFFYVDVNGDKKPNTLGRDVFQFVVTQEKQALVPAGTDNDSAKCTSSDTSNEAGIDCAAKVLQEDKINY